MPPFKDIVEALKLEHTIFALPFAYLGLWVAAGGFAVFTRLPPPSPKKRT